MVAHCYRGGKEDYEMDLDRFAYGLPDAQAKPAALIATCCCGEDILLGEEVVAYEDNLYCDSRCLMRGIGAVEIAAGMED